MCVREGRVCACVTGDEVCVRGVCVRGEVCEIDRKRGGVYVREMQSVFVCMCVEHA